MKSLSRVEPLLEGRPLVSTDVEFCNPTVNIEMGDKYRPFPSFSVVHQVFDHVLLLYCVSDHGNQQMEKLIISDSYAKNYCRNLFLFFGPHLTSVGFEGFLVYNHFPKS